MKIFFSKKKFGKTIFLEKVVERERDSSEKLNNSFILEKNINTCLEKQFFAKVEQKQKLPASGCWYYSASIWKINGPNPVRLQGDAVPCGWGLKENVSARNARLDLVCFPHPTSVAPSPSPPDLHDRDSTREQATAPVPSLLAGTRASSPIPRLPSRSFPSLP